MRIPGPKRFQSATKPTLARLRSLRGGVKLTNWKPVESDPKGVSEAAKGKLWVAEIPAELRGQWQITSLYDGTKLLKRSRSPEFFVSKEHKQDRANAQPKDVGRILKFEDPPVTFDRKITYENENLKNWENISDIEIHMEPKHHWLINLLPLESIDPASKTATFTIEPTYGFPGSGKKGREGNAYHVENAIDYLDEPGEWCFNSLEGRVYIWPKTPLAEADIRAPYLQEFIRVEGVEDKYKAAHLIFDGLTFRHGLRDTWMPGDKALQHDWEMYDKGNAMMRLRHAEHCTIKSCVFEASSGTGVRLDLYCQYNAVKDNIFAYLGGTGILLSGYAPGLKDESKFNTVTNNYIHHIGTIYQHSPAIFIAQSGHNKITHNTIHDLDYNAMVISGCRPHELAYYETLKNRREWVSSLRVDEIKPYLEEIKEVLTKQWLNSDVSLFEDLLHARENLIAYNDISRVMLKLNDGNAIYFSGMGKNNVAEFNYIHDVLQNRGFIRLDDNSGYTYIRNNVFENGRMMLVMKWDAEYRNNFAINVRQITNQEWYPAKLDRIVFYSTKADLISKENWITEEGRKVTDVLTRCSNSIFFVPKRADEFETGQDLIAKANRDGADVGMSFDDPLFDEEAMKQRIFRFKPGSPATKLGIELIDLSTVGSTLAPKGAVGASQIEKDNPPVFIARRTSDNAAPDSVGKNMAQQLEEVGAEYSFDPVDGNPVHLILLSGQSNMASLNPDQVFTPEIKRHFGAENVVIVKVAQKAQPIRRWFKGWKVTGDQNPGEIGDIYERLMKEAKAAMSGKSAKSVTLIWMQGERDAKERLSDQYEAAFRGLLEQIKADLKVAELNYVIGRLSDSGLGKKDWDNIRAIQQKLGEAGPRAAWVNTDDLNDSAGRPNDLHYSKAGYDLLAKRYVEKVVELLK